MSENEHYKKAMAKVNENEFVEAIELFTIAISEEPDNPFIYNQRAVCYLNLNQFDLSLFDMNKSIELDEKYAYFYSCRGFLKARMQDLDGALLDYEISLELDPENDITYNNMGLLLEQMGNIPMSKKAFDKANEKIGYDPEKREFNKDQTHMVDKKPVFDEKPEEKPGKLIVESKDPPKSVNSKEGKKIAKDVFSKKSVFKEFIQFIRNGFKLAPANKKIKNDKS